MSTESQGAKKINTNAFNTPFQVFDKFSSFFTSVWLVFLPPSLIQANSTHFTHTKLATTVLLATIFGLSYSPYFGMNTYYPRQWKQYQRYIWWGVPLFIFRILAFCLFGSITSYFALFLVSSALFSMPTNSGSITTVIANLSTLRPLFLLPTHYSEIVFFVLPALVILFFARLADSAHKLYIPPDTVHNHFSAIIAKTNSVNRYEAVRKAGEYRRI